MKLESLYILRHTPDDLSPALYSLSDHHNQVFSVHEPKERMGSTESAESVRTTDGFLSDRHEEISYERMVDLVVTAKKVMIL